MPYSITESGCWQWTGLIDFYGYGVVVIKGKENRAHRISYQLHKGMNNGAHVIMHLCDNKRCINPEHLREGTQQENIDDMMQKRRNRSGKKLNPEMVAEIKRRIGKESNKALAKEFGVDPTSISAIK